MKLAAAVAADSLSLVGLGRAPRVALIDVVDGAVAGHEMLDVQWDVLHGDHHHHDGGRLAPGEGSHHARIVTFLREHAVEGVMASHAGPPMVNTLARLGLPFLTGEGDALELAVEAAGVAAQG